MPALAWKDEYSVGVALFDEDHKQLLEILNNLYDHLCRGAPAEVLARICDELIEHTVVHFGHEEQYFDTARYPRAGQHRVMHERLKERLLEWRDGIGGASPPDLEKFVFFSDWLGHHIVGEDKKLGAYLNTQGIH